MHSIKVKEHEELLDRLETSRAVLEEQAPSRSNKEWLAALNATSSLIAQSRDIRQVLALAADKTIDVMDVDVILIFLLDDETRQLTLEASRGVSDGFAAELKQMTVLENGTVVKAGTALIAEDSAINNLLSGPAALAQGIKSQLSVLLRWSGERVVGALLIARRTPVKFHPDEVVLLKCFGNAIGAAVGNAYLHQEMKRALTALEQSEERSRDLFEKAYDAIWVHDLDGNMLAANSACEKLTGYSSEELMRINICQMMSEDSRLCIELTEQKLLHNEPVDYRCEGEVAKKDGGKAILQISTSLITQQGQPIGFQHCARDVTDERRLQENLRYYLQQVTRAQEEERKRIARELHDEITQRLITISRQLEKIISSDALWEESLQSVRKFKKEIELTLDEIRRFSRDLRPSVLDDLGLLPALELLTDDLGQRGIPCGFKVIGKARRLAPEVEVMLFRIGQEATNNIWRHAEASAAGLVMEFCTGKVRLSVKDNGKGFDMPQSAGDLTRSGKLGLAGMHERAKLLGGSVKLESKPGKGTTVTVEVPVGALLANAK